MEENIKNQLIAQDEKINAIYISVEKTRKYLLIIMWSSVIMVVLPILAMLIIVPVIISSLSDYSTALGGI